MTCAQCESFRHDWPDGQATYGRDRDATGEMQRKGLCEKYSVWVREDQTCKQGELF